ncbi:carbohydrate kinase [Terrimonas sp. NA20]|uniref:Carbohydrate kinase n=1 Tax=Terrimonas ginsenosidimutans TaxID=2908004 RepID=A0ABS9KND7_9BACT|nr:FGGY family carbohydrate kinase [Terrimonas ginsenosidimutans]MCG2613828.1 carbohydrate kinase [Terrimonas ginsenosidimutans]
MLLLGLDIGTSSIKASVVDAATQQLLASAQYPETESGITSLQPGWAEQSPEMWWEHVQLAILKLHAQRKYDPGEIKAIGIAYQMHGLVCVDKDQQVLRDSIIWCDSRAVELGRGAFEAIGRERALLHLLNSPGNFTASKLAWVKQNEPALYEKISRIMLPGDFIAMKLTGEVTTSISALSEGVFWDFQEHELSKDVFNHYKIDPSFIPTIKDVFTNHGEVPEAVATALSLTPGIPVTYKAGDQPNNALSLNVLNPGEVAATAGTSGVIYAVSDQLTYDNESRVNTFAHVNYTSTQKRLGVLLNINGTGILNRWIKNVTGDKADYRQMNDAASGIAPGSEGVYILPFGNGAERMLGNRTVQAHINGIDFNRHHAAHLFRASQEGIAFAFRYGLDIMRSNGINPSVIRASKTNMFLSNVFTEAFVNATGLSVELYHGDGSVGAAIGAGLGAGIYNTPQEAFKHFKPLSSIEPSPSLSKSYDALYEGWKQVLSNQLNQQ